MNTEQGYHLPAIYSQIIRPKPEPYHMNKIHRSFHSDFKFCLTTRRPMSVFMQFP